MTVFQAFTAGLYFVLTIFVITFLNRNLASLIMETCR
jgi:hypothetical protein